MSPVLLRRKIEQEASTGPDAVKLGQFRMLSPRQAEIVELVTLGCSDKEIAGQLGLTEGTVGWYLNNIFKSYQLHSRAALVAHVLGDRLRVHMQRSRPARPNEREG